MQQSKYANKSKFNREKLHVYSEADINRIDNKQNQWNEKRKDEREHNLKMASNQIVFEEPKSEEKIRQPRSDYIIDYAEDVEEEEEIEYDSKMKLVMKSFLFQITRL